MESSGPAVFETELPQIVLTKHKLAIPETDRSTINTG
jgi:hypothetical protein